MQEKTIKHLNEYLGIYFWGIFMLMMGTVLFIYTRNANKPKDIISPCIKPVLVCKVDSIYANISLYNNTSSQCDNSPEYTASGAHITKPCRWVAVSRDILAYYHLTFGDTLNLQSAIIPYFNGDWIIQDVGSTRIKNRVELLICNPHQIKMAFSIDHQLITFKSKR